MLANPTGKSNHPPMLHIRRETDQAIGHFVIFSRSNFHDKIIAIPPDWDKYAAEEIATAPPRKNVFFMLLAQERRIFWS